MQDFNFYDGMLKKTEQQQWNMRENAHDDVFKKSRSQLALMSDF